MRRNNKSTIIHSDKLSVENKTIFVDLKENDGGRFLQVTELSNAKRSTVVIPDSGVTEFLKVVEKVKDQYL